MDDEKEPIAASEQNQIEVELSKAFHLLCDAFPEPMALVLTMMRSRCSVSLSGFFSLSLIFVFSFKLVRVFLVICKGQGSSSSPTAKSALRVTIA